MIHNKRWRCKLCKTVGKGDVELKRHFRLYHEEIVSKHEDDDNDLGFILGLGAILTDDSSEIFPEPFSGHGGEFGGGGVSAEFSSPEPAKEESHESESDNSSSDSNGSNSDSNDSNDSSDDSSSSDSSSDSSSE